MPLGTISNVLSVAIGGLLGSIFAKYIGQRMIKCLTMVFGLCSIASGVTSLVKATSMPVIILSVILGTFLGEIVDFQGKTIAGLHRIIKRLPFDDEKIDMQFLVTVAVVFCVSGFGMYGVFIEGMSGDPMLLYSKSILDFFSAVIFAGTLGSLVCLLSIPQAVIMLSLFFIAQQIAPCVTGEQIQNFMACGGVFTIAAGLTMSDIKRFPLVNLLPALVLVMPLTWVIGLIA